MQALPSPPLSLPRPTHLVLLPGRQQWLHTCHKNPVDCDDCLEQVAEFLAREFQYELTRALDKTTLSYRAELGEDVCSLERANVLRRMTSQHCHSMEQRETARLARVKSVSGKGAEPSQLGYNLGHVVASMSASAAAPVIAESRDFFCEIADQWQDRPCDHVGCQPQGAVVVPFPQPDETAAPGWQAWAKGATGFLLLPLVLLFGAGMVVVIAMGLLFGGEVEGE